MSSAFAFTSPRQARSARPMLSTRPTSGGPNPDVLRISARAPRHHRSDSAPRLGASSPVAADNHRRIDSLISRPRALAWIASPPLTSRLCVAVWECSRTTRCRRHRHRRGHFDYDLVRISTDTSPSFVNAVLDAIHKTSVSRVVAQAGGSEGRRSWL